MKISIIVPVYNVEQYLRECLTSLVNQTLQDVEILVVNDGSTDQSLAIMDEFEAQYPSIVKCFSKSNGGQASARNMVLPLATGEYLGFVDSDDWVDPEMYETMCKLADEHTYDVVVCDMVDHFPTRTLHHHASEFTNKFKQTPSSCNKIFRRSLAENLRFPEGYWYEDFNFTTKILMQTDHIGRVHEGFYHCHCREVSTMSNNNSLKNLDMLYVIENLIEYAKAQNLYERYEEDLTYIVLEHVLITTINRVALQKNDDKKAVLKQMRAFVQTYCPNFKQHRAYQDLPRNRRIIASLNARGLHQLSAMILKTKSSLK